MKSPIAAACMTIALTATAATAVAADAKGSYRATGAGASTCAAFAAAPPQVSTIVGVWVQGYATALNQLVPGTADVTAGRNEAQLAQELLRVCNKNPKWLLADAAREMIVKLGAIPKKTAKAEKKAAEKKAEAPADAVPELRR